ncbi:MAG: hypothetical protein R3D55_14325 [Chloroflexota bacterium]
MIGFGLGMWRFWGYTAVLPLIGAGTANGSANGWQVAGCWQRPLLTTSTPTSQRPH